LANVHYVGGDFTSGESLVEHVVANYEPAVHGPMAWQFGFDAWVSVVGIGSIMSWASGDIEKSRARLDELERHALLLGHPESLALALFTSCVLKHCSGDWAGIMRVSQHLEKLAGEHRIDVFFAYSQLFQTLVETDVSRANDAVRRLGAAGHAVGMSYQLLLLAEVETAAGQLEEGAEHLNLGIAHAEVTGEKFWLPKLLCRRAALLHRLGRSEDLIEADLNAAIAHASNHGMLMFELEARLAQQGASHASTVEAQKGSSAANPTVLDRESLLEALRSARAS
jgi:hypothetical protein